MPNLETTHTLICRHCVGRTVKHYRMPCVLLKIMPDGRMKVRVFGDRYWKDTLHISHVRYVDANKVIPNNNNFN